MAQSVSQVRGVLVALTWMCLGRTTFVISRELSITSMALIANYDNGVQAYLEENWDSCIDYFENAILRYRKMKEATINCRITCQNKAEDSKSMLPENVENLQFYEQLLKKTLCLMKCKTRHFEDKDQYLPRQTEEHFESLKAYEYLQLCYYQKNMSQKAASAVFTFLVVNPNHTSMLSNLKFYTSLPEIDVDEIVNFEAKPYVALYVHGSEAYHNEDYAAVINYIEESLEEYLRSEDECRAFCEGPFDQGWFPDYTSSVANHFTYCLKCKRNCPLQLNTLNGEKHDDLLPSHYHFLQFAYFKVGNLQKACEAVESYLLFYPVDETMLSNREYYKNMPKVEPAFFKPREEALKYVKRQEYENKLLTYIEKEFLFESDKDNIVDENINESIKNKRLSGFQSQSNEISDSNEKESERQEGFIEWSMDGEQAMLRGSNEETSDTSAEWSGDNVFAESDDHDLSTICESTTSIQGCRVENLDSPQHQHLNLKQSFNQVLSSFKLQCSLEDELVEKSKAKKITIEHSPVPRDIDNEKKSKRALKREAVKQIQQLLMYQNVTVVKDEKGLSGKRRVLADGFANQNECEMLVRLAKVAGVVGDGYKGVKSPLTDNEEFLGMSAGRAALMVYFGLLEPEALQVLLDISERGRLYTEQYFRLKTKLYFNYSHLVCRTALHPGTNTLEPHMSHPIHGDNCMAQENGGCIKKPPSFTWRDYSALIYLNDDFEGGEFIFATNTTASSVQASVTAKCGRMVAFSSGGENLHGVRGVKRGSRCAIGLWFTLDPKYDEIERTLSKQVLDQVKVKGTVSDHVLSDLKSRTSFDLNELKLDPRALV